MTAHSLAPGAHGRASRMVDESVTAIALGSGDVPVLGTPAVLALIERAAVAAVHPLLEPDTTSVGVWAEIDHLAPSRVGATVEAIATLQRVDGRRLEFVAEAHDGDVLVARAKHRRVIVPRDRFA